MSTLIYESERITQDVDWGEGWDWEDEDDQPISLQGASMSWYLWDASGTLVLTVTEASSGDTSIEVRDPDTNATLSTGSRSVVLLKAAATDALALGKYTHRFVITTDGGQKIASPFQFLVVEALSP